MKSLLLAIASWLLVTIAVAQDSHRELDGPGQHTKFLTPAQVDTWSFTGKAGETLIAHVSTKEFDPVLELAKKGAAPDKPLLAIDDEGSESRFSFRLPESGDYEIRIHAFMYKGGGNYALNIQRFQAQPLEIGSLLAGTFDQQGKGYHSLPGVKDRILITEVRGARADAWTMLDAKGRKLQPWSGAVLVEEPGEQNLIVTGRPNNRYEVVVREAQRKDLLDGKKLTGRLEQGDLDVWSFTGAPGDFRVLEVSKQGALDGRLIFAPMNRKEEKKLSPGDERPEIQFLPIAGTGGRMRFAAILGRAGRFQLQLRAQTAVNYELTMRDPTGPIAPGKLTNGNLPVGGAMFYSFYGTPGQFFHANLASDKFVPVLRLLDARGNVLENNAASGDDQGTKFTHLIQREGLYRVQVASLGDGGGGDFRAELQEQKLKELEIGGRGQGTLQPENAEFWSLIGSEGKTLIVSARSASCELAVSLRGPSGVELHSDEGQRSGTDSLFSVKLPKSGKYTLGVTSRRGAGPYTLRLIDGD